MKAGQHSLGERVRQPVGWVVLAAGAASIALSHSAWSLHHAVHEAIEEAGALLIGACIVGRVFCTLYIGGGKNAQLVRHGPYSVARNPLYVFSLAGATGVGLSSASLVVGSLFGFAVWLLLSAAIRGEGAGSSKASPCLRPCWRSRSSSSCMRPERFPFTLPCLDQAPSRGP